MKRLKLIGLLALICCVVMLPSKGQAQRTTLNLSYTVSMPTSDFHNFISNNSYRGWEGSLLFGLNEKWALGLGVGFQDYYQKYPRAVYKGSDGSDISTVVTNSLQTTPVMFMAQYNFLPGKAIQPYINIGVGGNIISYRQYLGEFGGGSQNNFGFVARPGAGLFIPFRKEGAAGITINANYNYMPYNYNDIKDLNNWGGGIGIKFPLR